MAIDFVGRHSDCFFDVALLSTVSIFFLFFLFASLVSYLVVRLFIVLNHLCVLSLKILLLCPYAQR